MTTKINSDTSDGLKITSDTSGILDIQSAGTTKMTVGSTIDIQGNELVLDADADTSIHASTDDQIDFKTGGTDRVHIVSDGKVGIGTSSPTDNLTVSTTGDTNFMIKSGSSNNGRIHFADADDTDVGRIIYDHTNNHLTFWSNDNERQRIDSSGQIMMGSTSNDLGERLHVAHTGGGVVCVMRTVNSGGTVQIGFKNANGFVGEIVTNGSGTSYATSSDYRLKENVSYTFDATSRLKQLKPARFNFKADADTTLDGFLAHEVSSIVPEAVIGEKDATEKYTDEDGKEQTRDKHQSIDQSKLVPLLVKTIQELEARITALES
jgi:hypothetical protein